MNFLSWFYTLKSYLDSYLGFLKGSRFWSLIWVCAICVVIWFYGESLGFGSWRPLEDQTRRIIAIAVVIVCWLIYLVVSFIRRRRRDKALIEGLADGDKIDPEAASREEVGELRSRLREALLKMRALTKKRYNFVYDFPWYMIIGAPGSGKTTTLTNSGLNFPLGEDLESVGGVGGTRNCDWWFTDEAILIDTAGRYTTQDSDATVDSTAWQGFLGLLKKHRPLKPINGVIVTLSVEDALTQSQQARLKEIRTVRQRLRDLEDALKVRVPVYLVFTKVDVIAGFAEFFDSFNKFDREQVLGTTFPLGVSQSRGKIADAFGVQYDLILERLNRLLVERMQQEPDDIRRSRVFRFPAQFAAMKSAIIEQVAELTAASKLTQSPILRGVYFASATQSGQVYDKIRSSVSERFAFLPEMSASGSTGHKPYFLSRLFNEVIFNEANLVTTDPKVHRRKRVLTAALYSVPIALACLIAAGWTHAWFTNRATISAVNEKIALYNTDASNIRVENVDDSDVVRTVEPLNYLRAARYNDIQGIDRWFYFGLSQERKLAESIDRSYAKGLNGLLLPRLLVYLQDGMSKPGIEAGDLYNKLKLYLMFGGFGKMDSVFAEETLAADFEASFPGAGRAAMRRALVEHVRALVTLRDMKTLAIDEKLVEEARQALRAKSPAERIYQVATSGTAARHLPDWRISDKTGPSGEMLLERKSGKPLRDGIRGIFTREGFYSAILGEIGQTTERFLGEGWVLGEDYTAGLNSDEVKRSVINLYLADYRKAWGELVQDMAIRSPSDLTQAASLVSLMVARNNPLQNLASAIGRDSDLTTRPDPAPVSPQAREASKAVATQEEAADKAAEFPVTPPAELYGGKPLGEDARKLLYLVDDLGPGAVDPYASLRDYTAANGEQPAPINTLTPIFNELHMQLTKAATSSSEVKTIFGVDGALASANQRLLTEAQLAPPPVDNWLGQLAAGIAKLTASGVQEALSNQWEVTGGRFCKRALEGRYPFERNAQNDVAIDDFNRIFGPGGEFSTFFELHMKPFVDVSQSPWRWTGVAGNEAVASDALAQFERARRIQSAFFANGTELSVSVDIEPATLDNDSTSVNLTINDQVITYDHGPIAPTKLKWPGDGNRSARISFEPPGSNASAQRTGPWAMFRLFDMARRKNTSENTFTATFAFGKRYAGFNVVVGSVLNPFNLSDLAEFRCPERL
ncbi:type VI secretion system membrane subunit TssM [Mesorhizobium retamae]|uniref:Type VI secretion system membrane subunit TssM n=1 Tax=Mesorhizobium retamae TaxID=2912854 RepID=A0ABS9Q9E2_9HYPH|nr:type VI secretion system membrane subunit TssM [Mesorhizobium sp. IRAMC:0171]MCG7504039.1 type VI secretion system membrane subunit TssM [Mesorhizobium sp. IRAMC:0171]